MGCFKDETCVVLEFSSAESVKNIKTHADIKFSTPSIIEIAAVKIINGKIAESFSRFFSIDGYAPNEIELDDADFNNHGVSAAHLIGAPLLKEEIGRLKSFIGDSTIIMRCQYIDCEFKYFNAFARERGVEFNNAVINVTDLLKAYNLQSNIALGKSYEDLSTVEIAQYLKLNSETWTDLFISNNVSFDPSRQIILNSRDDILSWALAIAQLYINLYEWFYPSLKPIDGDAPF